VANDVPRPIVMINTCAALIVGRRIPHPDPVRASRLLTQRTLLLQVGSSASEKVISSEASFWPAWVSSADASPYQAWLKCESKLHAALKQAGLRFKAE
jgi:hypothetical protein